MSYEHGPVVFLVSPPRAGSTLLQRILANHPDIHTCGEPWIMLHPLYGLRQHGHQAEYNAQLAFEACQDFLDATDGRETYLNGLRRFGHGLYRQALANSGKRLFLDKTPRYYYVLKELAEVFPEARFVILLRHPLAVLTSIIRTWVKREWRLLYRYRGDLLDAPGHLLKAIDDLGSRAHVIRYEVLVRQPRDEVAAVCEFLDVAFDPQMLEYGDTSGAEWRFGDPTGVRRFSRPSADSLEKWRDDVRDSPQVWRFARDYLEALGEAQVTALGYSWADTYGAVNAAEPPALPRHLTLPLELLLAKRSDQWTRKEERLFRYFTAYQRGGWTGLLATPLRRTAFPFGRHDRSGRKYDEA